MLVAMPYAFKAFLSLAIPLFLCFGPFGRVYILILWSRPTSIHLGLYQRVWIISLMHVYVYLLASMLHLQVFLSWSRFFHALCLLWVFACRSLRPLACVVASIPLVDSLDVTIFEIHLCGVGLLDAYPFSTMCDVVMLALCHPFGFLCFFASLHACLHVHA